MEGKERRESPQRCRPALGAGGVGIDETEDQVAVEERDETRCEGVCVVLLRKQLLEGHLHVLAKRLVQLEEHRLERRTQLGRFEDEPHEGLDGGAVLPDETVVDREDLGQPLVGLDVEQALLELLAERHEELLARLAEQRRLVAEVPEDRRPAHAGAPGDLGHRGMLEAALAEQGHRRLEDAVPRDGLAMSRLDPGAPPLVLVFHALDLEAARVRLPGWRVVRCRPGELTEPRAPTLAWIRTGMGIEAARRTVGEIPDLPIEAAVCTGFAGALARHLPPRMLVAADPLLDAEGRSYATPLAEALATAAERAGLACTRGALVTVAHVAETAEEKARLHAEMGALAVDMESAVLAAGLADRGIPAAAVRVVLDAAHEEIPSSLGALWRQPSLIVSGVRIAARMRPCARISARLLEAWLGRSATGPERDGSGYDDGQREA